MSDKSVLIEVSKISDSKIKFNIQIQPELMPDFREKALRQIGEEMSLGGFRKGRAPIGMVEEAVDAEKILLQTVELAVNEGYYQAVIKHKDEWTIVGSPKITFLDKTGEDVLTSGMKFEAEVEIIPEIEVMDLKKIKLEKQEPIVTPEELETEKDRIRKNRSTLKEVDEKYLIAKGDWCDVDFEVFDGEEKMADVGSKHFPLIIGKNSAIPGFEEQLTGLAKGEKKSFELDIEDDFHDKRIAGKKIRCDVVINEVKQIIFPEWTDELVKSFHMEGVDTVDKLNEYLQDHLKHEKEHENEEKWRNAVFEKITDEITVEVPEALLKEELDRMWAEFIDNIARYGMDPQEYIKKEGLEKAKVYEGWKDQGVRRIRFLLIMRAIVKKENITIDKDDINMYTENALEIYRKYLKTQNVKEEDMEAKVAEHKERLMDKDQRGRIENELIIEKVIGHIKEQMGVK